MKVHKSNYIKKCPFLRHTLDAATKLKRWFGKSQAVISCHKGQNTFTSLWNGVKTFIKKQDLDGARRLAEAITEDEYKARQRIIDDGAGATLVPPVKAQAPMVAAAEAGPSSSKKARAPKRAKAPTFAKAEAGPSTSKQTTRASTANVFEALEVEQMDEDKDSSDNGMVEDAPQGESD